MAISNNWRTPRHIFDVLDDTFMYEVDVACDVENKLCPHGLTIDKWDALSFPWAELPHHSFWCNPPYNDILPWAKQARLAAEAGKFGSMLVPASISAPWFRLMSTCAAWELYASRIKFVPSPDMEKHWAQERKKVSDPKEKAKIGKNSPKQDNVVFHFGLDPGFMGWRCGKTGLEIENPYE